MFLTRFARLRTLARRFGRGRATTGAADETVDAVEEPAAEVADDDVVAPDHDEGDADQGGGRFAGLARGLQSLRAKLSRARRSRDEDDDEDDEDDEDERDTDDGRGTRGRLAGVTRRLGSLRPARLRRRARDDDGDDGDEGDDADGKTRGPKLRGTTGLLVCKDRVVVRAAGRTSEVHEFPYTPGELGDVIAGLRSDGVLGSKVVCSVEGRRMLTLTRRAESEHEGLGATEVLTREIGRLQGGLVADAEPLKLPNGAFTSFAACPGEIARELWRGLDGHRPRDLRLVPTDHALYRAAEARKSAPRRWRKHLRVVLDGGQGLALVVVGGHVVASRSFVDPVAAQPAPRARAIEIGAYGVVAYAREEFGIDAFDGAVLHVEDDPEGAIAESLAAVVDGDVVVAKRVGLDSASVAAALTRMAAKRTPDDLDVFRDLHAPSGFKENFPGRAVALLLTTLAFCSWLLWDEVTRLEGELGAINGQLRALMARLDTTAQEVPKLHEVKTIEWNTATAFVADRIFWSEVLDAVPDVLPEHVVLNDLNGRDRLQLKKSAASGTQAPRRLLITGRVEVDDENVAPPEVGIVTDALRATDVFRRNFPRITGANVKMMPGPEGMAARMTFMCLPRS